MRTLRLVGFFCVLALLGVVYILVRAYRSPCDWFVARLLELSGDNILVPGAIFLSATVAGAAAAFSIAQALNHARCENTLDFLNLKFTKPNTLAGIRILWDIVEKYEKEHSPGRPDLPLLHAFDNKDQYPDVNFGDLRQTLNYLEHLAVGVRKRIYDERLVFDDMGYTIFRFWRRCNAHVTLKNAESRIEMLREHPYKREGISPAFSGLIWLVKRWQSPWYCRWVPPLPTSRKKKLEKLRKVKAESELLAVET